MRSGKKPSSTKLKFGLSAFAKTGGEMSRVFISGSSTGLGLMAAQLLVEQGHQMVLHGRNQARADDARRALPEAQSVIIGDLSSLADAHSAAD
jgi:NAD(P)-dependent dehydrogenase (short-subunit alcohol dehydrogenase family)